MILTIPLSSKQNYRHPFWQIQQCALGRNFRQRITETESQRKRYQPYPVERWNKICEWYSTRCRWIHLAGHRKDGIYKSIENKIFPNLRFSLWEKSNKNNHYCLHKDRNGGLWFGDNKGNILWVNPTTGETVIHQLPPETADSAVTAAILKLYLNSQTIYGLPPKRNNGL